MDEADEVPSITHPWIKTVRMGEKQNGGERDDKKSEDVGLDDFVSDLEIESRQEHEVV